MAGTPTAVRVGPGWLYIAPVDSVEPTNLSGDWAAAWVPLGYTDQGSSFMFDNTFENVVVEEEYDPVHVLQTARQITLSFAAAELTARNVQIAFNGGTIDTNTGVVTFEPPDPGVYTPVAIGWESDDGLERWIYRRCVQVGSVEIQRRKAPQKAIIPMQFRATKPDDAATFSFIHDADYVPPAAP
jgi:hypothetical protein